MIIGAFSDISTTSFFLFFFTLLSLAPLHRKYPPQGEIYSYHTETSSPQTVLWAEVDFGLAISTAHHYLVEFGVPRAAANALDKKIRAWIKEFLALYKYVLGRKISGGTGIKIAAQCK